MRSISSQVLNLIFIDLLTTHKNKIPITQPSSKTTIFLFIATHICVLMCTHLNKIKSDHVLKIIIGTFFIWLYISLQHVLYNVSFRLLKCEEGRQRGKGGKYICSFVGPTFFSNCLQALIFKMQQHFQTQHRNGVQ